MKQLDGTDLEDPGTGEEEAQAEPVKDPNWLDLAQSAMSQSTTFVDNNYRKQWENNLRHFQSKHHRGSKYLKASYKYRSKLFRPKSRSATRNNEAACAAAFFSNMDVLNIEPRNPNDQLQIAAAAFQQELLQIRLTESIPWFLVCIGAFQDAHVIGTIASHQYWDYRELMRPVFRGDSDGQGNPLMNVEGFESFPLSDKPVIEIVPIENLRIHPSADWTDPANSSPYLIHLIPMYVQDVKAKMKSGEWKTLEDGEIKAAGKNIYDSTRQTREGDRTDKTDEAGAGALSEFDVVWVHRNIMRIESRDLIFYTMGTEHLLTDPVPLEKEYPHCKNGKRPFVIGTAVIETHKIFTSGVSQLGEEVQKEINEVSNQRRDNVKFVLNKRWFVRTGSNVDIKSITRNVPGSVTFAKDPRNDVVGHEFNDVTGSSYQEQDRLNLDYDEVVGSFSASSIQSNRKLNETVGGMRLLAQGTQTLAEYILRTFSETWVEPVLRQLIDMEREYETDEVIMALAMDRAKLSQLVKMGASMQQIRETLLAQELVTTVNVGMNATDPVAKVNNFRLGLSSILEVAKNDVKGTIKIDEVAKEVFGRIGYKDGSRFLNTQDGGDVDPEKQQMAQTIQQLQVQLNQKDTDLKTKITIEKMQQEGETERQIREIAADRYLKKLELAVAASRKANAEY